MTCQSLRRRFAKQQARSKSVAVAMRQNCNLHYKYDDDVRTVASSASSSSSLSSSSSSTVCSSRDVLISSSSSAASSSSYAASSSTCVKFGSVEVREYNRSLGQCLHDVPNGLALGWEYRQRAPVPIEEDGDGDHHSCETKDRQNRRPQDGGRESHGDAVSKEGGGQRKFLAILRRVSCAGGRRNDVSRVSPSRPGPTTTRTDRGGKYFSRQPTSAQERTEILRQFGFSTEELEDAENERLVESLQSLSCVSKRMRHHAKAEF